MTKEKVSITDNQKLEELRREIQHWKSQLQFTVHESLFFTHLLDSDIFVPNILNLFEHLQHYKNHLKKAREMEEEIRVEISKHITNLGKTMEQSDNTKHLDYYLIHDRLKNKVANYFQDFQRLKSEIFNYVAGVIKKHRS